MYILSQDHELRKGKMIEKNIYVDSPGASAGLEAFIGCWEVVDCKP
jgi:hypothetical protein